MLYLTVKANLENIAEFAPNDSQESPFEFIFKVTCTSCREQHATPVIINLYEQHEVSGSKGEASLVMKCKFCTKESTINIAATGNKFVADAEPPKKLKGFPKDGSVPILEIEGRGLDVDEFIPQGEFVAVSTGGKKFELNFDEDEQYTEWYDYDDDMGEQVAITDAEWKIVKLK